MKELKNKNNNPLLSKKKIVFSANIVKEFILGKIRKEKKLLLFSVLAFIVIAVFGFGINLFSSQIQDSQIIKEVSVKQGGIIAGQPVKWTMLVKRSQIKENQHLVQLPKGAKNITIKTISATQAKQILSQQPAKELTLQTRQQLVSITPLKPKGIFAKLTSFLFASVGDAVDQLTETVTEIIIGPENQDVIQTSDASFVDLSGQIIQEPTKEEIKEQTKEEKKTDKKEEKKKDKGEPPTKESEETPPLQEEPIVETPVVETPLSDEGTLDVVETPIEETPVEEIPIIETPIEEVAVETPVIEETPTEYVQIDYETPAPKITEQNTDTGKLVTVSSSDPEAIDCESLNPNKKENTISFVFKNTTAGLLSGFTNALKSITKFLAPRSLGGVGFTADLEQAVSDVVETITGPAEPEPAVETSADEPAPVESGATSDVAQTLVETLTTEIPVESPAPADPIIQPDAPPADVANPAPDDSAYQECLKQHPPLTDVLAFTSIPEIYKVGQENKIRIKWKNENDQDVAFHAYDLNNNGKLDYIEWTVPHLSDQVFEIIFISKAFKLDQDQNILEDIYDTVAIKDGNYATINNGEYIRVTFEKILDNTKDITIYAKSSGATIEVYAENTGQYITSFENINQEKTYKVLLTNLQTLTDIFDLKIIGGSIDFDYIVDPTATDTFTDSSKINTDLSTNITVAGGQVKLSVAPFVCGTSTVQDGDTKSYNTVSIGTQCWMASNLDYNLNNCTAVTWVDSTDNGWCGYYTEGPFADEGLLYQWSLTQTAGLCPTGWHVPTDTEYMTLTTYLADNQGDRMKKSGIGICYGATPPCGSSGFNGLLAGYRNYTNGLFYLRGTYGYFWSSTQFDSTFAWLRRLYSSSAAVSRRNDSKANGFSVRCLKD